MSTCHNPDRGVMSHRGWPCCSVTEPVGPAFVPASRRSRRLILMREEKPVRRPACRQEWRPHVVGHTLINYQRITHPSAAGSVARSRRQKGGALLAVLWLSAALAAISFSVASSVRSETNRVASSADGLRAWYLATGSVERAVQWMMWGPEVRNPDGS